MLIHRRVSGSIVRSHSSAFYTLPLRNDMWIGVVQWIYKMMWYVKIKALYQQYSTTSRVCCILLRMCSNLWFGPTVNFVPRDGSTKKTETSGRNRNYLQRFISLRMFRNRYWRNLNVWPKSHCSGYPWPKIRGLWARESNVQSRRLWGKSFMIDLVLIFKVEGTASKTIFVIWGNFHAIFCTVWISQQNVMFSAGCSLYNGSEVEHWGL